jgi:bifunctional DNA-binding transcriptional regulator/antitoxin component of YhaV-PrlF toxin-antitoxin module
VGNKGRVVIPAGLRESQGWTDDTNLVFIEDDGWVKMTSLDQLERRVREDLKGSNILEEFLAERRETALREDDEMDDFLAKHRDASL